MTDLKSRFRGSMIGLAIGDALGMPVEGWTPERIRAELGGVSDMLDGRKGPAGTWTDDTAMTIAVAESLIECGDFCPKHMRMKFLEHYDPKRGYGLAVKLALDKLPEEKKKSSEDNLRLAGKFNGSAMRIAPVGLLYHDDPAKLKVVSYESSKITHENVLAHEGAALQAYAVACLVNTEHGKLDPNDFLVKLEQYMNEDVYRSQLGKIRRLMDQSEETRRIVEGLGNTVEAHRSVPTAVYSFITHPEDFRKAVLYAVNLGGDSDTIGSMAGALSGAYLGEKAIPLEWRNEVESADYLYQLADKLSARAMQSSVSDS